MKRLKNWITDFQKYGYEIILNWIIIIAPIIFIILTIIFSSLTRNIDSSGRTLAEIQKMLTNVSGIYFLSFFATIFFAIFIVSLPIKFLLRRKRTSSSKYLSKEASKGW